MVTEKKSTVAATVVDAIIGLDAAETTHRAAVCVLTMAYKQTGLAGPDYAKLNSQIVEMLAKRMGGITVVEATRRANPILRVSFLACSADLDLSAKKDGKLVLPSVAAIRQAAFNAAPALKTNRGKKAGSKNKATVARANATAKVAGEVEAAKSKAASAFNSSAVRERFYNNLTPTALAVDFKVMWALMALRAPAVLMSLVRAK